MRFAINKYRPFIDLLVEDENKWYLIDYWVNGWVFAEKHFERSVLPWDISTGDTQIFEAENPTEARRKATVILRMTL